MGLDLSAEWSGVRNAQQATVIRFRSRQGYDTAEQPARYQVNRVCADALEAGPRERMSEFRFRVAGEVGQGLSKGTGKTCLFTLVINEPAVLDIKSQLL